MDLTKVNILEILKYHFVKKENAPNEYPPTVYKFIKDAYLNFNTIDKQLYLDCLSDILSKIELEERSRIFTKIFDEISENNINSFLTTLWNETVGKTFVPLDSNEQKIGYDNNYKRELILANVLYQNIVSNEISYANTTYITIIDKQAKFYVAGELVATKNNLETFLEYFNNNLAEYIHNNKIQFAYTAGFKVNDLNKYEKDVSTQIEMLTSLKKSLEKNDIVYIDTFLKNYFYSKLVRKYRDRELEEETGLVVKAETKEKLYPYERLNGKNKFGDLKIIASQNSKYFFYNSEYNNGVLTFYLKKHKYPSTTKILARAIETTQKENILRRMFMAISPHFYLNNENVDITTLQKQYFYIGKYTKDRASGVDVSLSGENIVITVNTELDITGNYTLGAGFFRTGYNKQLLKENKFSVLKDKSFTKKDYRFRDEDFNSDFDDREITVAHFLKGKQTASETKKTTLTKENTITCPEFLKTVDANSIVQMKLIETNGTQEFLFNIDKVVGDTIYFEKRADLENVLPVQVYIYEYIQADCKPKRKELPPSELINTDKGLALTSTLKINDSDIENKRLNIYTEQTRLPIIYNEDYKTLNIASTGSLLSVSVSKKNLTINNDKYSKYSDKELLFFDDNEQYLIRTNGKNIKLTKSELTNLNFYQYGVSLIAQQNRLIVKLPEEQTTIPLAVALTCSDNRLLKELRQDIVFDTTNIELTAEQSRLQVPIILDEPEYNPITVKFDVQVNFDNDKNYDLPITMQIINNRSLMLTELKQTITNIGYRINLSVENSELISA